ncbi:MAG: thiamine pyrophosphate-dependent enzyme, partial [Paludibacteraceae bacterium]
MQNQIGVKIILLNNNYLGMVRQWQELFFKKRYSSTIMENPDFSGIARAYGIASQEVSERENLKGAIDEMMKDDKPYMLIVNTEEEGMVYPMTPAGDTVTHILLGDE